MPAHYLMSRKWSMNACFTITVEMGVAQFKVEGSFGLRKPSLRDNVGAEVAALSKRAFSPGVRD
jgi:hypothetical protein